VLDALLPVVGLATLDVGKVGLLLAAVLVRIVW
jgi:hypothetical protein